MPQVSAQEFDQLPLRVHSFLAGVPLHDVWTVDFPRTRSGVTLEEFLQARAAYPSQLPIAARALFQLRFSIGRLLGWDREPGASAGQSFATRLTAADRAQSRVSPGTREGLFRVLYRFENELLLEAINRTVHGAALTALVEGGNHYRLYFAVYVRNVSRFTPVYMAMIDPFRKLIVYPALLRSLAASWNRAFGPR
jgi:hypothetical protein